MKNVKLIIEYDGTGFHGWQKQPNLRTVEDELTKAIKKLTGEEISILGCSRTDKGVHACGQVANFITNSSIPNDRFSFALNSMLPVDIVIKKSEEVGIEFHSRYHSISKKYRYRIFNETHPSAMLRDRTFYVRHKLDIEAMKKAAQFFVGTHDFAAFKSTGSNFKTSTRTIYSSNIIENGETIDFEIHGNGFLYNMVRIIVGTLVEVGLGNIDADSIPEIIESKNRKLAGKTALAQGLYLVEISY